MKVTTVRYEDGEETFEAFVARPQDDNPRPAVLVCHTWVGRDDFADNKARQLAELGYVGVALDLYGMGNRGHDRDSSRALMMPLLEEPRRLRRRLEAGLRMAQGLPEVDRDRMGAIGFCFGGMCSILMARMGLPLCGVVSFHGLLKIGEPLESRVRARILVLHGQDDPMVVPADIGTFAAEMQRIGARWDLRAYPGVMHGFTNPKANDPVFGTVYNADADRDSWQAMTRFFTEVFSDSPEDTFDGG